MDPRIVSKYSFFMITGLLFAMVMYFSLITYFDIPKTAFNIFFTALSAFIVGVIVLLAQKKILSYDPDMTTVNLATYSFVICITATLTMQIIRYALFTDYLQQNNFYEFVRTLFVIMASVGCISLLTSYYSKHKKDFFKHNSTFY